MVAENRTVFATFFSAIWISFSVRNKCRYFAHGASVRKTQPDLTFALFVSGCLVVTTIERIRLASGFPYTHKNIFLLSKFIERRSTRISSGLCSFVYHHSKKSFKSSPDPVLGAHDRYDDANKFQMKHAAYLRQQLCDCSLPNSQFRWEH